MLLKKLKPAIHLWPAVFVIILVLAALQLSSPVFSALPEKLTEDNNMSVNLATGSAAIAESDKGLQDEIEETDEKDELGNTIIEASASSEENNSSKEGENLGDKSSEETSNKDEENINDINQSETSANDKNSQKDLENKDDVGTNLNSTGNKVSGNHSEGSSQTESGTQIGGSSQTGSGSQTGGSSQSGSANQSSNNKTVTGNTQTGSSSQTGSSGQTDSGSQTGESSQSGSANQSSNNKTVTGNNQTGSSSQTDSGTHTGESSFITPTQAAANTSGYTDGTYTASSLCTDDDEFSYDINVSITIENGKIMAVTVEKGEDTSYDPNGNDPFLKYAIEGRTRKNVKYIGIVNQIIQNQSADNIDVVSGATYSSKSIAEAAKKALESK
jgi:uncharacterized protein with FMN-binding domain